jgi:hypothetical protein
MSTLLNVSLRQTAVFIPSSAMMDAQTELTETTAILVANLAKLGFGVSESLLQALNRTTAKFQLDLLETFRTVMGINKNWTPLVKGWDTPTGESKIDHILTFYANAFQKLHGTRLACGHLIPDGTFPLERYNGCPFCGTPFEFGELELLAQGSKLKYLSLWTEADAEAFFKNLLESKTALDATQIDSLKILLRALPIPAATIGMKETVVAVADACIEIGESQKAEKLFGSPTDILRYLWYKHTGFMQIVEPKVIARKASKNSKHLRKSLDASGAALLAQKAKLKLKYSRTFSKVVASWLNALPLSAEKACEMMHAKRNIWVRFIRALRLPEYSHRAGFEPLARLLDVFYNQRYEVWQGEVDSLRLRKNAEKTFALLSQRPGLFARSLFANMLWFGADTTCEAFAKIIDKVPARLLFTLNAYAPNYFDAKQGRTVKPLGGGSKLVPANPLLKLYNAKQLDNMKNKVGELCLLAVRNRFANAKNENKTIFIAPALDKIPVSIGDRSDNVQDLPSALMGTRFPIEGDTVRIFMQWGEGMPAQHLDMDLSCRVAFKNKTEICYFGQLTTQGCKHSGDIRSIPHNIGTAEYININIEELQKAGAIYATFTCNAYSNGSITPNLVLGWMSSKHKMKISQKSGVAYDPSCVQHQVRITQSLAKGLVFGVLEVATREIIWLEMGFDGQLAASLDVRNVQALLQKLDSKLNVGALLRLKAEAQNLTIVDTAEQADEAYTVEWARDTAAVTRLLVD